jgi:methyl-accepting chemotaxis protein
VSSDRNCELGKWIYLLGAQYSQMPEYATLKKEHARFHSAAGDIVRKADQGQHMSDEIALGAHSEYALASGAVVRALMAMKGKVQP